jgi:hypothetical protein
MLGGGGLGGLAERVEQRPWAGGGLAGGLALVRAGEAGGGSAGACCLRRLELRRSGRGVGRGQGPGELLLEWRWASVRWAEEGASSSAAEVAPAVPASTAVPPKKDRQCRSRTNWMNSRRKIEQKIVDSRRYTRNLTVKFGGDVDQHKRQQICGSKPQKTQQIQRSKFELFFGENFFWGNFWAKLVESEGQIRGNLCSDTI